MECQMNITTGFVAYAQNMLEIVTDYTTIGMSDANVHCSVCVNKYNL
jgi:hypothetical protein